MWQTVFVRPAHLAQCDAMPSLQTRMRRFRNTPWLVQEGSWIDGFAFVTQLKFELRRIGFSRFRDCLPAFHDIAAGNVALTQQRV